MDWPQLQIIELSARLKNVDYITSRRKYMTHHGLLMFTGACRQESWGGEVIYSQYLGVTQQVQEYQKQAVGCRNKRLEAVRLFGVFHDFSCVAEQVTDILDPVLEIGCKKLLQVTRECMLEIIGPDSETEIKTSCIERC